MRLKKLDVEATWYVLDVDLKALIGETSGPADRPYLIRAKGEKIADEHARRTGHTVVLLRPESYH